jgi:hypothetical protein
VRSVLIIIAVLTVIGIVESSAGAASPAHRAVKHHRVHHLPARRAAPGSPMILVPAVHQRYRYGGPLYSTCDRINADRMLVGTCR